MARIIFSLVLVIFSVSQVVALSCYDCATSATSTACDDPVRVSQIGSSNCDPSSNCIKLVAIGGPDNRQTATIRSCVPDILRCSDIPDVPPYLRIVDCAICSTDLCNSSVILSGGFLVILPVLISRCLLKLLQN